MQKTFKARLTGISPLLMHSCANLDPTSPMARAIKEITSKRKNKTDADLAELKRLEWRSGLYVDEKDQPAIPADNILAVVIEGARKSKLGKQAQAAVFEKKAFYPINYEGPKGINELYEDGRFCDYRPVRNQQNRVMRARPIFRQWSVDIELIVEDSLLNPKDLKKALEDAGEQVGLGDFRPRHGRFLVEVK